MGSPFVGEIRMFGGSFAPAGWSFCDGSLQLIANNSTLFNLIGTTYGGDGQSTFGLPNLLGRVPIHMGTGGGGTYVIGQLSGAESVTLTLNQIPLHNHTPQASNTGGSDTPNNNFWGKSTTGKPYALPSGALVMNAGAVQSSGGSQPHNNLIPYTCINYIISLFGVFPSPN